MAAWALARAGARDAQRTSGPQARDELALERAAALHVERLVDRLVRDPHPRIIGELQLESLGDLLRTPPAHPAAILAVRLVAPLPRRRGRPGHRRPARGHDHPGKPLLHVLAQPRAAGQLGRLRALPAAIGVP